MTINSPSTTGPSTTGEPGTSGVAFCSRSSRAAPIAEPERRRVLLRVQHGHRRRGQRLRPLLQPHGRHRRGPCHRHSRRSLAALLVHAGSVPGGSTVEIDQGHALGRPSRLTVAVRGDDVRLDGTGLVVGSGRLLV